MVASREHAGPRKGSEQQNMSVTGRGPVASDSASQPDSAAVVAPCRSARTTTKRRAIRWFCALFTLAIFCDSFPTDLIWPENSTCRTFQTRLNAALSRIGIWEGDWKMFAPDPAMSISRVSAEFAADERQVITWESPAWRSMSSAQRFRHFREINYFDRLLYPRHVVALGDFGDYLFRTYQQPATAATRRLGETISVTSAENKDIERDTIKFFKQSLRLVPPDDGVFPSLEEATWMSSSEPISAWSVSP